MRTNSPPDCWLAVRETERAERDKDRERQRGACKERNEKTKAECKEWWYNHIFNSKPIQLLCFVSKISRAKTHVTYICWIQTRDEEILKMSFTKSTRVMVYFFPEFINNISLKCVFSFFFLLACPCNSMKWEGCASPQMSGSTRRKVNIELSC